MTRIEFTQVDAFADRVFAGNPAAVMPLSAWLDDATLQAIAAENNLSETAFTVPTSEGEADYELRWFTPTSEVALCGHATLATGHVMLSAAPTLDQVTFLTRQAGELTVARGANGGYELTVPNWKPDPKPLSAIVAALGVATPFATLWHPKRYGLVVLESGAQVRACTPDFRALAAEGDVLTIVTAALDPASGFDVISRAFAPGAGIDEDPVTGSAHAVLIPYWGERLGRDQLTAYQASARGGRLDCRLEGDRVVLGGACVTVIEGTFLLP